MPELIEVELYRRDLSALVGQRVVSAVVHDARCVRPKESGIEPFTMLDGATLGHTTRHGKLLLATFTDVRGTLTLGLRFGMTGRLLIDGTSRIAQLEYASAKNDPAWDRFTLVFDDAVVALRDQRCLGSVELDPDTTRLGPEASTVTGRDLSISFAGRSKAVKAALLDQTIIAGLGNLLTDEVLWAVGMSPHTSVDELSPADVDDLAREICSTVDRLTRRGGSNEGDSFPARRSGAPCPSCGGVMRTDRVGGRTTWWCPTHQC